MKVCFLLSYTPAPRIKKRIELIKENYETSLIYWERTDANIEEALYGAIETVEINILSNIGNPLSRVIPTLNFAYQALKNLKRIKPHCIYVENMDMLSIARLYCLGKKDKIKIVYEIADIHSLLIDPQNSIIKRYMQKFLKMLDRRLSRHIDILVNTSYKFYEAYYSKFVPGDKLIVFPNVPNLRVLRDYKPKTKDEFTIGFIGTVRYKDQMKMLINAADKEDLKLLFAGSSIDDEIGDICHGKDNIDYYGEYDYNTEIAKLYGMVDCIFSVYDADLSNVRIAIPNKLYESIYCEIPIIVAKGTYLAELVEEMGVGVAVSHTDEDELVQVIKRLSSDKRYFNSFVESCRIHKDDIDLEKYNEQLMSRMDNILKDNRG